MASAAVSIFGRAQRRRRIVVAQLDRQRGIQLVDRFLISAEIVQEHAFIMQHTCIVHVVGALLPANQTFELLRQRQSFRVASGLSGFVHLRGQRVDGVTGLSRGRLTGIARAQFMP
jgi:hypothetical protein